MTPEQLKLLQELTKRDREVKAAQRVKPKGRGAPGCKRASGGGRPKGTTKGDEKKMQVQIYVSEKHIVELGGIYVVRILLLDHLNGLLTKNT